MLYKERCEKEKIPENHHAIPRAVIKAKEEEKAMSKKQAKLDGSFEVVKSPGPTEYSQVNVLHAVAQFVACDDQVRL